MMILCATPWRSPYPQAHHSGQCDPHSSSAHSHLPRSMLFQLSGGDCGNPTPASQAQLSAWPDLTPAAAFLANWPEILQTLSSFLSPGNRGRLRSTRPSAFETPETLGVRPIPGVCKNRGLLLRGGTVLASLPNGLEWRECGGDPPNVRDRTLSDSLPKVRFVDAEAD
jgi:hypothetical protein